ncbi:MIP/aquaporin family protein [Photorhabdus heterorhabditis]|uniref:MIP/aquaporin family protein n=1 Tax=Photorhabdus heterorhabditis TaxID=880156 RepID=UPI00156222EA|nr:MIP/aquaporin family protein [Photorhabdus heterorhabditis]NRN29939.1 aquaporin [Photorhabdus heterorhabditis subsp. aluminescens]
MSQTTSTTLTGQCIAEFLGTALLVFFGLGCVAAARIAGAQLGLWEISIIWGLGVALAVYLTAGVSGGHLNPAVTIALWLFARFSSKKVIPFIIAQMIGGFVAAAIVYTMYYNIFLDYEQVHNIVRGTSESLFTAGVFSTYPMASLSIPQAFMIEAIIAAVLLCLIMALTDDGNGVPRGPLAPLLIGILIAVIGGAFGPLTGFALNPARDFSPKLVAYLAGWGDIALTGGREIPYCLVTLTAPIIGGIIGAFGYRKLIGRNLPTSVGKTENQNKKKA